MKLQSIAPSPVIAFRQLTLLNLEKLVGRDIKLMFPLPCWERGFWPKTAARKKG